MKRFSTTILSCVATFLALFYLFQDSVLLLGLSYSSGGTADYLYNEWHECMLHDMKFLASSTEQTFWTELENPIKRCETITTMRELSIQEFSNLDETKYSIFPIDGNTGSTAVTVGVGQDVRAELMLQQMLGNNSVHFYGADPIVEGNDELYSKFGTFFPFAVGNSSRMGTASVLLNDQYVNRRVIHVELVQFLKEIVGKTFFDNIWIDGEYAEYEMFDYFLVGGRLDQAKITVCQLNMEVHLPSLHQKKLFRQFIERMFNDRRYAFFRPVRGNHIRLFFVNFKDPHCVKKYITN